MDINTTPTPIRAVIRLSDIQRRNDFNTPLKFFAIQIRESGDPAPMAASQTVLALVRNIQKKITAIATKPIIRQIPELLKMLYKPKGMIKNNAEAKRFLCVMVAKMT